MHNLHAICGEIYRFRNNVAQSATVSKRIKCNAISSYHSICCKMQLLPRIYGRNIFLFFFLFLFPRTEGLEIKISNDWSAVCVELRCVKEWLFHLFGRLIFGKLIFNLKPFDNNKKQYLRGNFFKSKDTNLESSFKRRKSISHWEKS